MKVSAVSVPDAASDPAHPDHDRWVKDKTLQMEVDHAKRVGLPLRVAEAENQRLLERSERIGEAKPLTKKFKPPAIRPENQGHNRRASARNVTVKHAKPRIKAAATSPCGRCGTCRRCKREKRVFAMSLKAKAGDLQYASVLWKLAFYAQQAQDGTGPFVGVPAHDANRMVIAKLEEVCDASVKQMGPWL